MGILQKIQDAAGNKVAQLSALSPNQVEILQEEREKYLLEMPDPADTAALETTEKMMAASSIEIFNAFLPQIKSLYLPVRQDTIYDKPFDAEHNIRYFNITKWVTDKKENNLERLANVYAVLSNENCNIALVFNRTQRKTNVYLAVVNINNADSNVDVNIFKTRMIEAIRGNFPGAEWTDEGSGVLPCFENRAYSVASASNIPAEKSEKFVSQTIEKLLDGVIPDTKKKEYTIVLLATPIKDVEERKLRLGEFYSGMVPYASWQTDYHYSENESIGSSATVGVNVGASAGVQNGVNNSVMQTDSETDQSSKSETESESRAKTQSASEAQQTSSAHADGTTRTDTTTEGISDSVGGETTASASVSGSAGFMGNGVTASASVSQSVNYNHSWNSSTAEALAKSATDTISKGLTNTLSNSIAKTTGTAVANTLGKAVTTAMAHTSGTAKSVNLGANFGANFARSSTVTAMLGINEGITQTFENYNIKHALELLEIQMKRMEQSSALGMWDFAAYVLSEDQDVANNVAHSYLALTLGEDSYMSRSAVNLWRGNVSDSRDREMTKEICDYIRTLRHPIFGLNPETIDYDNEFYEYPPVVTATTALSGKELAYSLNFPQKSVSGLPVLECAEFGRNVVSYNPFTESGRKIELGSIFHMNHEEESKVDLSVQSLASHTFITGSTGSGKSNTVYQMLKKARKAGVHFLVVEPAKGEYKNIFGNDKNVSVYGTNPMLTSLLRINPFSFPKDIHVLEHMDRLVEIFNVCWPMYAAMPAVLKSAVEQSYIDCGWDMLRSVNKYNEELYPSFADVARNIKVIIEASEYDAENKGAYKGSLLTRLQSLTTGINGMLFSADEIASEDLFDTNVIVDLSRVGSSETKSLIMGMLVLKLQEYRMSSAEGMNQDLHHLTVLEEAHNILRRTSTEQSSETANLLGKSVEMLANAIAEMRTYGEGFIIADQAPGLMDMSVIRNTNTKIIMRLPDEGDRNLVGRSANLNEEQILELAKLPCGVAAVYQNEWVQPVLCKVDKYTGDHKLYQFTPDENEFPRYDATEAVTESLLDCIMNQEVLRKGNRADIRRLKDVILHSRLSTIVKKDYLEYMAMNTEESIIALRSLIYDFLQAEEAIRITKDYRDIDEWMQKLTESLKPSIKGYQEEQIDLAIGLILFEQADKDISYRDLFNRYTEICIEKGEVF